MLVVSMTINMSQQCQCNIDAGGGGFEAGENVVYIKKEKFRKETGKNCQCPNNFATECSYRSHNPNGQLQKRKLIQETRKENAKKRRLRRRLAIGDSGDKRSGMLVGIFQK